jgi:asparagine synthase (glutamine-hydrolysing)
MCGIAGFTAPGPDARPVLAAMTRALAHRGPDGSGIFVDQTIALGHTRLAVIDPGGGAQPRVDPQTGDALVFNGEIYGYRAIADALRKSGVVLRDNSDTEVLFQLIRRHGVAAAVSRIDGMFAFAYRDGATGALYLVRDRFGEKPLYYGSAQGSLVFASEVSALMEHPGFREAMPDRLAAYALMLCEYLPGRLSGWEGIAKLEPGTILTAKDGRVSQVRYWRPPTHPDAAGRVAEAEAAERLDSLLRDAVRRRVVADVPLGVLLSGGLDSSLIAALAAPCAPNLTAFSVRIGGHGFDETPAASTVARHLGIRHEIVELGRGDLVDAFDAIATTLAEPLADSSLLPSWLVCRAARRSMTVALGGDGADELFAGYPNFAVQRFAPAMQRLPRAFGPLLRRAVRAQPHAGGYMNWRFLLNQLSHGFGADRQRQSYLWMAPFDPAGLAALWQPAALSGDAFAAVFAEIDRRAVGSEDLSDTDASLYRFLVGYLPDDILTKTDRASMFNGLEVRAPFLDRAFAEYAWSLPTRLKLRGRTRKYILKRVAARHLPATIVHRRKHGFAVPIGALMRDLFRERCRDVLLSRHNRVADWFERARIERLLDEHDSGRADHGKKLWTLYILFAVAERHAAALFAKAAA